MSTKPHQVALTLSSLGELADGAVGAIVNAALRAAFNDTEDRGGDKKARKVTIEVEMKKAGPGNVAVNVRAKAGLPPYQTEPTIADIVLNGRNAEFRFSPASASNPDQPAIPGTGRGED